MPWRKQTLTPFRSSNSNSNASVAESVASASVRSFDSRSSGHAVFGNLFGDSEFDLNWDVISEGPQGSVGEPTVEEEPGHGVSVPPGPELIPGPCKVEMPGSAAPAEGVILLDSESSSSESASDGASIESDSSEEQMPPSKRARGHLPEPARRKTLPLGKWYVHKKSGLLHQGVLEPSGGDPARQMTGCGRTISVNYEPMSDRTEGNPICIICQRRCG
eukprot:s1566_g20.t1